MKKKCNHMIGLELTDEYDRIPTYSDTKGSHLKSGDFIFKHCPWCGEKLEDVEMEMNYDREAKAIMSLILDDHKRKCNSYKPKTIGGFLI